MSLQRCNTYPDGTTEECDVEPGEEVGYIQLDDTVVALTFPDLRNVDAKIPFVATNSSAFFSSKKLVGKWLNVQVPDVSITNMTDCDERVLVEKNAKTPSTSVLGKKNRPSVGRVEDNGNLCNADACEVPGDGGQYENNAEVPESGNTVNEKESRDTSLFSTQKNHNEREKEHCYQCNLILNVKTSADSNYATAEEEFTPTLHLESTNFPFFDGTISDMYHCQNSNMEILNKYGASCRRQRSDSALLLGAALQCRRWGYVRIESFQIILKSKFEKSEGCFDEVEKWISSIILTFSVPHLERMSKYHQSQSYTDSKVGNNNVPSMVGEKSRRVSTGDIIRPNLKTCKANEASKGSSNDCTKKGDGKRKGSIKGCNTNGKRRKKENHRHSFDSALKANMPSGALMPCAQLLYSLLRCDWPNLNMSMELEQKKCHACHGTYKNNVSGIEKNVTKKSDVEYCQYDDEKKHSVLFPKEMSLEEMYHHMCGRNKSDHIFFNYEFKEESSNRYLEEDHVGFMSLPEDILCDQLSPFLRSMSLENLRVTCKTLRQNLSHVVPGLKKIQLYKHQIKSLQWMRWREACEWNEAEAMKHQSKSFAAWLKDCKTTSSFSYQQSRILGWDMYNSVTAGSVVCVTSRKRFGFRSIWRLNGYTGQIIGKIPRTDNHPCDYTSQTGKIARGGLLCDDPGLGKTITVLSLILQTFGQNTYQEKVENLKSIDEEIFEAYWKNGIAASLRPSNLLSLLQRLRKSDRESYYFYHPVKVTDFGCEDYYEVIKHPICFKDIMRKIDKNLYGDNFQAFVQDIDLCFYNAMQYNDVGSRVYIAAERLSSSFCTFIETFKKEQITSARHFYGGGIRMKSVSDSLSACDIKSTDNEIASLCLKRSNCELFGSLQPSSATLLVVPCPLLHHWEEQISIHINFNYCSKKVPLFFYHGKCTNKQKLFDNVQVTGDLDVVNHLCCREKSHFPFVFIDEVGTTPLPPPKFIAIFHIVLTTSNRMIAEWKNGSFQDEIRKTQDNKKSGVRSRPLERSEAYLSESDSPQASCPLLKVYWLRLVVDEGHSMGASTHSNSIMFASWITAQRRWAMTGTPTPQTTSSNGLRNIFGLLKFLKHDYFCPRRNGENKWKLLKCGFSEGRLAVFYHLKSLLSFLMIRHTINDIEELPKPRFRRVFTQMSVNETLAYNTLVAGAQINIVTTSMKGETSGWQDSLLNPRQVKHAQKVLGNLRIACSGGTRMLPTIDEKHLKETLNYLRFIHKVEPVKLRMIENFLHRVTTEQLSSCMKCGFQVQVLLLTPCACLVCSECIDPEVNVCPSCSSKFDFEDFQRLQPGLTIQWKWNVIEAQKKREEKARMRAEVNEVRSFENDNNVWNRDDLSYFNVQKIINGNPLQQNTFFRKKGNHSCVFPKLYINGKCMICKQEHDSCYFINEESMCNVCYCKAEDCPKEESKATYVINTLLRLHANEKMNDESMALKHHNNFCRFDSFYIGNNCLPGNRRKRPLKVIIFSQFRQILNVVGDRLIRRLGSACVADYWGKIRHHELNKFTKSPNCFCMLLGRDGSHGLDLSFVTHIFFLDEIMDKSVERQVVARAYRMGATGHVEVEQLVARNTVEEMIVRMNNNDLLLSQQLIGNCHDTTSGTKFSAIFSSDDSNHESKRTESKNRQQAKMHYILKSVKFIRETKSLNCAKALNSEREKKCIENSNEENSTSKQNGKVQFHC